MRHILFAAVAAVSVLASSAAFAATVHYMATLKGSEEVPANTTSGQGMVMAALDTTTKVFTYEITYSGLTGLASAAHFHGPAMAGVNAPPIVAMTSLASPIKGSATLTDGQIADLAAGKWYFNVHTSAHPGGEIRGQLMASK
jgi:hypothetical protein